MMTKYTCMLCGNVEFGGGDPDGRRCSVCGGDMLSEAIEDEPENPEDFDD